jgi:nitroreductase
MRLGALAACSIAGGGTSLMLAARALGIATVPQASIVYRAEVLSEQLQIAEDDLIVCGASLGWSDKDNFVNSIERQERK